MGYTTEVYAYDAAGCLTDTNRGVDIDLRNCDAAGPIPQTDSKNLTAKPGGAAIALD